MECRCAAAVLPAVPSSGGCGPGAARPRAPSAPARDLEPVTLLLMTHWSDEQFERDFKEHVEEAFDHITLDPVSASVDDIEEEIFAKEIYPDIIMTSVSDYLLDMDLDRKSVV